MFFLALSVLYCNQNNRPNAVKYHLLKPTHSSRKRLTVSVTVTSDTGKVQCPFPPQIVSRPCEDADTSSALRKLGVYKSSRPCSCRNRAASPHYAGSKRSFPFRTSWSRPLGLKPVPELRLQSELESLDPSFERASEI